MQKWETIFPDRLRRFRKRAGLSQQGLGELIGSSRRNIQNWEGGEHAPGLDAIYQLAGALGVSPSILVGDSAHRDVPVVSSIVAGAMIEQYITDNYDETIPVDTAMIGQRGDTIFGLKVRGLSMTGAGIFDGDVAICSSVEPALKGDVICYYQSRTGESTIKRLGGIDQRRRIVLVPCNLDFEIQSVELGEGDQVKKVIAIWRKLGTGRRI